MNDLDIMRRAKTYMDSLARGIDPLSGSPVPPGDALRQERLCRCFRYVAGVLEKLIAEQALPKLDHGVAVRAILSAADVTMSFSREPVPLGVFWTELYKRQLAPLGLRSVGSRWLLVWLGTKGLLTQEGRYAKPEVSERGRALGLSVQSLKDAEDSRWRCLAAEPLQRMIVEDLEEFIVWDQDQWDRFLSYPVPASAFSQEPVRITVLAQRISAPASGVSVKTVTIGMILRWLIQKGYMREIERTSEENLPARIPTPEGNTLGITLSGSGKTSAVFYHTECQHFIADHLPEIVDEVRFLPVL